MEKHAFHFHLLTRLLESPEATGVMYWRLQSWPHNTMGRQVETTQGREPGE